MQADVKINPGDHFYRPLFLHLCTVPVHRSLQMETHFISLFLFSFNKRVFSCYRGQHSSTLCLKCTLLTDKYGTVSISAKTDDTINASPQWKIPYFNTVPMGVTTDPLSLPFNRTAPLASASRAGYRATATSPPINLLGGLVNRGSHRFHSSPDGKANKHKNHPRNTFP